MRGSCVSLCFKTLLIRTDPPEYTENNLYFVELKVKLFSNQSQETYFIGKIFHHICILCRHTKGKDYTEQL